MGILIGIAVGLLLGLTGAGGSILAVPLLMGGLHWPITQAATAALLAVSVSALVGTVMAWHHSYVRYRAATLLSLAGIVAAPWGIRLADGMHPVHLQQIFALVLAVVALRMLWMTLVSTDDADVVRASVAGEGRPSRGKVGRVHPATGRLVWSWPVALVLGLIGAATGFLSGLLGVGGGFVLVPALRSALPLSMHSAVATSLMTIALTSMGAFVAGVAHGREVPWMVAVPFVSGAVIGMVLGGRISPHVAGHHLQRGFAGFALLVAMYMGVRAG
jgi:hypothetical protein